jgi:hypothetical protein
LKREPEVTEIINYLVANPFECGSLIGATVRHKCGSLGKLVRTEYVNNRSELYFRFNGGPFKRPEPRFFLQAFDQGTLRLITVPETITEKFKKYLDNEKEKEARERAKERLSLVNSKDLVVFPLPNSLQNFIAQKIGWKYAPIGIEYNSSDEVGIKNYMGTYFPRSFLEAYALFSLLFQKEHLLTKFLGGDELSIIDIGTGTGGNFLGFLWALRDRCLVSGYSFPNIKVTSVEKNVQALNVQVKLIKEFFPDHVNIRQKLSRFLSGSGFLKDLTSNSFFNGPADLIMCWKFICEFYNPMDKYKRNKGMYGSLLSIANKHLKEIGILVICDVTKRAYGPYGRFLPSIMNQEAHKILISKKTDLVPILPLSCAHWYDCCSGYVNCFVQKHFNVSHSALPPGRKQDGQGVFLKVFARKPFAKLLMIGEKEADGYVIGRIYGGGINTCQHGTIEKMASMERSTSQTDSYPDAFEWTEQASLI